MVFRNTCPFTTAMKNTREGGQKIPGIQFHILDSKHSTSKPRSTFRQTMAAHWGMYANSYFQWNFPSDTSQGLPRVRGKLDTDLVWESTPRQHSHPKQRPATFRRSRSASPRKGFPKGLSQVYLYKRPPS